MTQQGDILGYVRVSWLAGQIHQVGQLALKLFNKPVWIRVGNVRRKAWDKCPHSSHKDDTSLEHSEGLFPVLPDEFLRQQHWSQWADSRLSLRPAPTAAMCRKPHMRSATKPLSRFGLEPIFRRSRHERRHWAVYGRGLQNSQSTVRPCQPPSYRQLFGKQRLRSLSKI